MSLENFISETPFSDFVFGELSKELQDHQEFDSDSKVKRLIDLPAYSDVEVLADRLVQSFEDLPRRYRFTFKLNREVSQHIRDQQFQLSDSIRLIRPNDHFEKEFPLESGISERDHWLHGGGLLSFGEPKKWDRESVYLQIEKIGFVGSWVSTTPMESSVASFKSILGTCLALRAFKIQNTYSMTTIKRRVYVHQYLNEGWEIYDSFELDEDLSNIIINLKVDTLNGTLQSDEQKAGFLNNRISLLGLAASDLPVNERVLLAGRWLLDNYSGKNELLSFVQATVALEILLGDKKVSDLIGLGELLRNRCAYLIGKTHAQRDEILKDFKKIYDIRSRIVHRGKDRLKQNERRLFNTLQWMVNRVIQEEIERVERKT